VTLNHSNIKNIILIGSAHPLRGGGITTFNERLATEFLQQGFQISIFSFSLQYPSFLFPGKSQYSNKQAPPHLTIHSCINSINPFNWIKIGKQIKKLQPDIVIVRYWLPFMGPCLGTILRVIKNNKHTKIVCIADNIIPHEKRLGDKIFTKYFIQPVDAFITMSENVLKDLRLFTTQKPAILVPHPLYDNFGKKITLQTARQLLQIDEHKKVLLFFGFIRQYKGLHILLDAMQILKNKLDVTLIIAGEFYEDAKPYQQQIENLGLQNNVKLFANFIPVDEVKNYFCAADVVVQPYINATQSGVTPIAYHFEVPMIVTNVGGLANMVPNGKVGLVAESNAASIAKNIELYFSTGKDFFTQHLVEEKKKYTWKKMTDAILSATNLI
jgi:glycosyltransferase involved in cell wall biosynthesis